MITLTRGTKSLSVKLDKEEEDGVAVFAEGTFFDDGPEYNVVANTGVYDLNYQFTQGMLQFSSKGMLQEVYFKAPELEIRCFHPDLKKILVENGLI